MIKSLYISYNAITEPIVQSQVIPYLRGLSKKGIKFYLLTFEKKKMEKEEKTRILKTLLGELPDGLGISWFSLSYHKAPTVPATLFDIILGCVYSIYIVAKNKIDIVHARAVVSALMGYPAARLLSKKFIFDTRGIDSEEYVDANLWRRGGFKHRTAAFLEDAMIKSADYVITLTEKFLQILKKRYCKRTIRFAVIPCAVDTERFLPAQDKKNRLSERPNLEGKFIITYIGSLGTWYMFPQMLSFFKTALRSVGNAHFLVLTQTDKAYAVEEIKKSGLASKDVTIDTVSYDAMPEWLSICDIGIFFIKPVFSKLSSSPVKFAEYLSCGIPVIINSGIGDTEDLVRRYRVGAVVERFDEGSYASAANIVIRMLKEEKDAVRARCREAAERELSLHTAVEHYYDIYRELLPKEE